MSSSCAKSRGQIGLPSLSSALMRCCPSLVLGAACEFENCPLTICPARPPRFSLCSCVLSFSSVISWVLQHKPPTLKSHPWWRIERRPQSSAAATATVEASDCGRTPRKPKGPLRSSIGQSRSRYNLSCCYFCIAPPDMTKPS